MKSSRGIVIALGAALAALALVVHTLIRDAAPGPESEMARGERRSEDDRPAAGMRDGAGATIRGGATSGTVHAGPRMTGGAGELSRRRLPEAFAGAARGDAVRGGATGSEGSAGDDSAGEGETERGTLLAHRDLPPAGEPGTQNAAAGDADAAPEPSPDVVYDGAGRVFDTQSRVQVPDAGAITANAGTISFWAKPEWDSGNLDHANFVQLGDSGLRVVKDGNFLRFEYTDSSGNNALGGVADISEWPAGDWRYITATWQGNTLALYIDGQQRFLNTPGVPPPFQGSPRLYIGSTEATNGGPVAPAELSYLTLMNRTLSSDEIRALFESGPPKQ